MGFIKIFGLSIDRLFTFFLLSLLTFNVYADAADSSPVVKSDGFMLSSFWAFYQSDIIFLILLVLYGLYLWWTWLKWGRDFKAPEVGPCCNPPEGWAPAMVAFFESNKGGNLVLASTLISLAVKRKVNINATKNGYKVVLVDSNTQDLSKDEKGVFKIIQREGYLSLNNRYSGVALECKEEAVDWVKEDVSPSLYERKNKWFKFFAILLILPLYAAFVAIDYVPEEIESGLSSTVRWITGDKEEAILFYLIVAFFFFTMFPYHKIKKPCYFGILGLFLFLFTLSFLMGDVSVRVFLVLTTVIVSLHVYFMSMHRLEPPFVEVRAKLASFKTYLKYGGGGDFEGLDLPTKDMALYERFLPYAIALQVPHNWTAQFSQEISQLNYAPAWAAKPGFVGGFIRGFDIFNRNFNDSIARGTYVRRKSTSSRKNIFGQRY